MSMGPNLLQFPCAGTNQASRGRKPKIKDARELSAPIFKTNDEGALAMNINLTLVTQALDMAGKS